ncbi:unnamed protein product, partial [Mesorhabditis belari]|uniref:GTP 3',8-cyclase n=1 Tax=Mesorhabditis belari TaxID=2138241 RepID=A0AAF3EWS3_9BILA
MRVSQSVARTFQTLCNASARQQLQQCSNRRCSVQAARKKTVSETPIIGTSLPPTIQLGDSPQQSPFYETPEIIINETRIQEQTMAARRSEVRSKIREIEERTGKIPLVDSFARVHNYLRISLTETCNFSCSYCMPAGGVDGHSKSDLMTNEEIIVLARVFARRGINKIRLTGGEPTLRKDLHKLIAELKKIDGIDDIGITTNGLILGRQLDQLKAAGLDKINISLDTLIPRRFEQMTKVFGFEKVFKAIDATEAAYGRVKVNVVVIRGFNTDELTSFVHATKNRNWDVRFIEFMPFGGNDFKDDKFVGYSEQLEIIRKDFGNQIVRLQDSPNDTSKAYKIIGHRGQFGFISSMSDNFCSTCNRVRLTANGNLKVCLHSNAEVSLVDALRRGGTERNVEEIIEKALWKKKAEHAGLEMLPHMENRPMVLIGG